MTNRNIEITAGGRSHCLDLRAQELYRDNEERVQLTRQQWDLLKFFVQNPRTLLTKDDLLINVWKRVAVNDEAISQAVRALRRALEDDNGEPSFIETAHGKGYRFVANVKHLPTGEDARFEFKIDTASAGIVQPLFPVVPISYKWNLPEFRERAIARFSQELARSPMTETSFVDYFNFVSDVAYQNSSGNIHIATMEFNEVWEDQNVYVPYEAMLVRYKDAGLVPRRLFLVDIAKLRDDQYRARFHKVIFRHQELGLSPRISVLQDTKSKLREAVGVSCDAYAVIKLDYALLIQLDTGQEPAMLKTSDQFICKAIRDVLHKIWTFDAVDLDTFESDWGALKETYKKHVEIEAAHILKINETLLSRNRNRE